ncbi:hypothetical protein HanRHA438_Chr10g0455391 [Helianthus annuus]|nr:hypothetical protein HanRHA438_Chr10g0455391 [Helianthus annuus]
MKVYLGVRRWWVQVGGGGFKVEVGSYGGGGSGFRLDGGVRVVAMVVLVTVGGGGGAFPKREKEIEIERVRVFVCVLDRVFIYMCDYFIF